ncbi:acetylglutamate kinase [Methanocella sp. CWC-04]|uniref:Acetylglutamate kinase n=1 Tax=Methanooceanicella nereidis TaxID=2052831 RepID=A0AAP2W640_9EURY|nr:acetylglutamate kinase [Methanocella sp. CWC-04]MCD1294958.1 acetylglutamate kinase [Methanocella sp. CWC-04]
MDIGEMFTDALPWLKKYRDAIIVIKVGGHAMVDSEARNGIIKDIVTLRYMGMKPVIVHGGGPEIDAMMKKLGKTPSFVSGLRVTDDETMDIVRMVLVGKVNTDLVALISRHGGKGIGLKGIDGNLLLAKKKGPERITVEGKDVDVDYGWVGETEKIDPDILFTMLEKGFIPVISPIGYDRDGRALNINADTAAGDIAASLKAVSLLSLTDVDGILMDPNDKASLLSHLNIMDCYDLIKKGVISKGMIPKVLSSITVLNAGIESVRIINGNVKHAVLLELLTEKGIGTQIVKE